MCFMEYLSVKQYADLYGVSEYTVRRWARSNQIEHKRIGRAFRIPANAVPKVKGYE